MYTGVFTFNLISGDPYYERNLTTPPTRREGLTEVTTDTASDTTNTTDHN